MNKTVVNCESTSSFSSIVGAMTSFAKDFFVQKFPTGFFKKIFIAESLNSNNLGLNDMQKYKLPLLTIKPELSLDSTYMESLPYWYRGYHYILKGHNRRGYYPILKDEEHSIYIWCIPNRIKINFNIQIKLPTTMYMYDVLYKLQNKFENGGLEFINNVNLQTEVPKLMMINLAESLGYNLSIIESREQFNNYLSKNSLNTVSENINLSTGNNNYAYTFKTNLLMSYQDSASGSKNNKNLVVDSTTVNFSFSIESWIPNKYLLELPDNRSEIKQVLEESEDNDKYKFNIVIDTDYIKPKIDDKHLILRKKYLPDVNVEYDEISYKSIINKELKDVIEALLIRNLLSRDLLDIRLMCGNKFLNPKEYNVDYKNFIVRTKNPMSNTVYTILIYGNLEKLNKVSNMITNGEINNLQYL